MLTNTSYQIELSYTQIIIKEVSYYQIRTKYSCVLLLLEIYLENYRTCELKRNGIMCQ
jgi:hypothetical protein